MAIGLAADLGATIAGIDASVVLLEVVGSKHLVQVRRKEHLPPGPGSGRHFRFSSSGCAKSNHAWVSEARLRSNPIEIKEFSMVSFPDYSRKCFSVVIQRFACPRSFKSLP
jgi:hypothetical protein